MPWDHNRHYHQFLLAQLPSPIERGLDIGCGHGAFAGRLADVAVSVDAIDADAEALTEAHRLHSGRANLKFIVGDFVKLDLPEAQYDVVTSLASVHHMDLVPALEKMKRVLRPGGVLVVLGLYRQTSVVDYVASAAALSVNLVYRHLVHRHNRSASAARVRVKDPNTALEDIRRVAGSITPGGRVRRHLLWRYSLIWKKPIMSALG
jgi:ubiquinone/menaquinone biosynthesis C-methylase UbiE